MLDRRTLALALCLFSAPALADYKGITWGLDTSSSPYKIGIKLPSGTFYDFGQITSAGVPTPYFPGSTCPAGQWHSAASTAFAFTCSAVPSNSVTNAMLATMAQSTIKGRQAGSGTGNAEDLTATQATTMLNAMVGDSGSGGTKGLVPAPAAGDAAASKFLKADGTWDGVTPSFSNQTANTFFAGPASGGAAAPAFRAMVCADLPSGAWCKLNTLTASNSASLQDTTSLTSTYKKYRLVFRNLIPATNSSTCQLQIRSGGSYRTTGYLASDTFFAVGGTSPEAITTYIPCSSALSTAKNANAAPGMSGEIFIEDPSTSGLIMVHGAIAYNCDSCSGTASSIHTRGWWNTSGVVDGFQILQSSGNETSGVVEVYGQVQ